MLLQLLEREAEQIARILIGVDKDLEVGIQHDDRFGKNGRSVEDVAKHELTSVRQRFFCRRECLANQRLRVVRGSVWLGCRLLRDWRQRRFGARQISLRIRRRSLRPGGGCGR